MSFNHASVVTSANIDATTTIIAAVDFIFMTSCVFVFSFIIVSDAFVFLLLVLFCVSFLSFVSFFFCFRILFFVFSFSYYVTIHMLLSYVAPRIFDDDITILSKCMHQIRSAWRFIYYFFSYTRTSIDGAYFASH